MKIKIGSGFEESDPVIDAQRIEVLSEDHQRPMFTIYLSRDGVSLEVYAGGSFKDKGILYDNRFAVHPQASNCVTLKPIKYE